jgi:hypothetical protein
MSGSASFHDRVGVQLWLLPFADKPSETAFVDSPKPISGPEDSTSAGSPVPGRNKIEVNLE